MTREKAQVSQVSLSVTRISKGEQPIQHTVNHNKTYTPYQQQIRDALALAWHFFEAHKLPRTPQDWQAIADAASEGAKTPLQEMLIAAIVSEIEREYLENQKGEQA
jgi:hypothetical protein